MLYRILYIDLGPILEIPKQDFFQEAKTLIAQHYKKINENRVPGTSINVFRNKHQKPKSSKFIPLEIKKKETLDTVRELQAAYKMICFPKDCSKSGHSEEAPSRTSFKEPHIFSVKKKYKGSIDLIVKEQVKLGEIVTNIDSVSKKMEKEKQQHHEKTRMVDSFCAFPIINLGLHLRPMTSSSLGLLKENDRAFYDWRGVVSKSFSCLARDSSWPSFSGSSSVFQDYYANVCSHHGNILLLYRSFKSFIKKEKQSVKPESKPQPSPKSILNKSDKLDNKVKRIGPRIEICQVFRGRKKFAITKNIVRMVIVIQALVRGWLERKRFQRIMIKALYHGPDLRTVINMYCRLIHRVKYRLGLWRTRQIINLTELEEWMDRKKFYETMFAKREDWQGLERSELLKYFNDCGHFPMHQQIDEVWDLVHREDHTKYSDIIKKSNAIEMLFTLYPPQGAHVCTNMRLRSTWLRPIVNGEEGYKYIVSGHPVLKRANIQIVGKLVARSMRERKMRQQYSS
ncbi:IQ domain-containing protein M [Kogia breviceps]|uniref:IQ domain-containing protein M n=1 Tax=Kogia breviceps TaxID=27615 RepID=UPI002795DC1D|nr:IQ domain-containing protein M [Kogia breviceps]